MAILAALAKRAFAHPSATSFVKRAVSSGQSDEAEMRMMPDWGFILLYLSLVASGLLITFVGHSDLTPLYASG